MQFASHYKQELETIH